MNPTRDPGPSPTVPLGRFAALVPLFFFLAPVVEAQTGSSGPRNAPSVFLDCQRTPCDRNHLRTEIQFVNWAQDRTDSDVHVIVTSDGVGGGGRQFTFDFLGRGGLEGIDERLLYTSSGTDVEAETRDGMTRVLRAGLLRYAVHSGMVGDFDIRYTREPAGLGFGMGDDSDEEEQSLRDPWNFWTFRVGLSGDLSKGENRSNTQLNPSLSANRVTESLKVNLSGSMDLRRDARTLSDGRVVRNDRDDWRASALIVRSISGHVSAGIDLRGSNSISNNQNSRLTFYPAVEYNYYPYAEANRRQLTVQYSAGMEHTDYREMTVFGFEDQTVPQHELSIQYSAREPWGNGSVSIDGSQYLHDRGLYSFGVRGNLSYRILRGLDLNLSGNASRVNDNIHTPAGDISDEDILLGRQNLPSSYQYSASVGLNYRWGSSFTNVVNTRFGGGGGGFRGF